MLTPEIQQYLQEHFDVPAIVYSSAEEAENLLAEKINQLIQTNFEHLVYLLYRIDVNEKKLKELLIDNPNEDAGRIIARLIIERQLQKIKNRELFSKKTDDTDTEEKW